MVETPPPLRRAAMASALLACCLVACTDEGASPPVESPDGGTPPDAAVDAGPDAGPSPRSCEPGEMELTDGSCQPAGIPADGCGTGFVPTGDGSCEAVLPETPCGAGQLAIPGDTACRDVVPCTTSRWGDAPVDDTTQYVDGAYGGGSSDGSVDAPWTSIQDGVDAAAPGAVVAIAAGTYNGDVRVRDKPVRLWGKCPAQVEIIGTDYPIDSVDIHGADGTEVHDLAISGPDYGVSVYHAVDVLLDRVWIHHTELDGLSVTQNGDATQATLRRSLVEHAHKSCAQVLRGAELVVEESTLRDAVPTTGDWGLGIYAASFDAENLRNRVEVRRSLISGCYEVGIQALGTDLVVEDTLVRDIRPSEAAQMDGVGILVSPQSDSSVATTFELRRSAIEQSHTCGVCVFDAHATVVATAIRDTEAQVADGQRGDGLLIANNLSTDQERPSVSIVSSTIERNHRLGLALVGVDADVEGTLVRDTASEPVTALHGRGLIAENNLNTQSRTSLRCTGSAVEQSHEVGLLVLGSEATLEGVAVRDTRPRPSDQRFGRGVIVQFSGETLAPSAVTLTHSVISGSHEAALYVTGADLSMQDTVIEGTRPQQAGETFGDGVIAMTYPTAGQPMVATIEIERCRIEQSARAGVSVFGATVGLSGSVIDCNTLDLAGEPYESQPFELLDRGSNVCGCAGQTRPCQVLSSGLLPPDPLE